tara:strand:+ start:25 stop:729 length:705 start_codon:yes stop_codon:yes gene_type:complete
MALPKINTPTYELELPSTGEKIKYRPFLIKEQKLLLMAQETGNEEDIANVIGDLVESCSFKKVDSKTAPIFDVEYLFLRIRGKSVGEIVELNLTCPDDGKTQVPVKVNLEDISVNMLDDHSNEILLMDDIKIIFRYPILSDMKGANVNDNVNTVFGVMNSCVHEIHYGDDVYTKADMSEKDIEGFIDQLTGQQFEKITDFFNSMPKLRHVISVTNPKTKKKNEIVVEGLQSFLG